MSRVASLTATKIQLFGQRGSGTNFLQSLIEKNLPGLPVRFDFGYKHGAPVNIESAGEEVLVCVIVRDPLDWIRSLHRQPWHVTPAMRDMTIDDFVRQPWHCIYDEQSGTSFDEERYGTEMMHERHPESGRRYDNALKMRTDRLRRWWEMQPPGRPVWWVQYEALARSPHRFIADLAQAAGHSPPSQLIPVDRYKGFEKGRVFRRTPRVPLSQETHAFVIAQLDWSVETSVGYFPRSTQEE